MAHRTIRAADGISSTDGDMLVNEAYLRLACASEVSCHDRVHFTKPCSAQLMRRILVDFAPRSRIAQARWRRLPDRVR